MILYILAGTATSVESFHHQSVSWSHSQDIFAVRSKFSCMCRHMHLNSYAYIFLILVTFLDGESTGIENIYEVYLLNNFIYSG
jgi:hypothetical protein